MPFVALTAITACRGTDLVLGSLDASDAGDERGVVEAGGDDGSMDARLDTTPFDGNFCVFGLPEDAAIQSLQDQSCRGCLSQNCCAVTNDCFASPGSGGMNACAGYARCRERCSDGKDAGVIDASTGDAAATDASGSGSCESCFFVYGEAGRPPYEAFALCARGPCSALCDVPP